MAKAEKIVKKVPKTVYVEEKTITLELTEDEAIFLKAAMTKVGGSPEGLRGVANGISDALFDVVGARYFTNDAWFNNDYYRDGTRCGFSFGENTSVASHITIKWPGNC